MSPRSTFDVSSAERVRINVAEVTDSATSSFPTLPAIQPIRQSISNKERIKNLLLSAKENLTPAKQSKSSAVVASPSFGDTTHPTAPNPSEIRQARIDKSARSVIYNSNVDSMRNAAAAIRSADTVLAENPLDQQALKKKAGALRSLSFLQEINNVTAAWHHSNEPVEAYNQRVAEVAERFRS